MENTYENNRISRNENIVKMWHSRDGFSLLDTAREKQWTERWIQMNYSEHGMKDKDVNIICQKRLRKWKKDGKT